MQNGGTFSHLHNALYFIICGIENLKTVSCWFDGTENDDADADAMMMMMVHANGDFLSLTGGE